MIFLMLSNRAGTPVCDSMDSVVKCTAQKSAWKNCSCAKRIRVHPKNEGVAKLYYIIKWITRANLNIAASKNTASEKKEYLFRGSHFQKKRSNKNTHVLFCASPTKVYLK